MYSNSSSKTTSPMVEDDVKCEQISLYRRQDMWSGKCISFTCLDDDTYDAGDWASELDPESRFCSSKTRLLSLSLLPADE